MPDSLDPRMKNGWAEYQRLVLAELERHNVLINDIGRTLGEMNIRLALMKEENGKIKDLQLQLADLTKRIGSQETGDQITDAVARYRKWIIGIVITVFATAIIPLIRVLLQIKGIGG